jgi:hypothetical protein
MLVRIVLVRSVLGAAAVVLGFLGGVQVQQVVAASGDPEPVARAIDPSAHADDAAREVAFEDCPRLRQSPPYPVNENGLTYGSGAGVDADNPGPDLVAAYGTNGRCGFVRAADRHTSRREVPLYAQDGVTVIGEYRSG